MNQFTNHDEAMSYLTKEFVSRGIFDADAVNAEIKQIVGVIPPTVREGYGDNEVIAAANFYTTYKGTLNTSTPVATGGPLSIQEGNGAMPPAPRQATERYERPILTDAQRNKVEDIVQQNQAQRIRNTPLTSIEKILVRSPKPSTYLAGKKVMPKFDNAEKLAEYEKNLVQTEENIAAFNRIKAAIGQTEMPVFINDKNIKIEGVVVKTPGNEEGKAQDVTLPLTLDQLAGFLVTRVLGRIPSQPMVGVELQSMRKVKKNGRHADASLKLGKPYIRWVGKADALAEFDKYTEVTTEQQKTGNKVETKTLRVRIEESFQVIQGKNNDGSDRIRTVRLPGVIEAPKFQRKQEFRSLLGELSDAKTLSAYLSEEEKHEALQKTIELFSATTAGELMGGANAYGEEFSSLIREIQKSQASAAATTASSFE